MSCSCFSNGCKPASGCSVLGSAFADACARGSTCGIGGYVLPPADPAIWFSERFNAADFAALSIQLGADLQKHIAFLEVFAQVGILRILVKTCSNQRLNLAFVSHTDNTGADARLSNLFSIKYSMFLAKHNILLDAQHVPGIHTQDAVLLSRWDEIAILPTKFAAKNRVRFNVQDLWQFDVKPLIFPTTISFPWFQFLTASSTWVKYSGFTSSKLHRLVPE